MPQIGIVNDNPLFAPQFAHSIGAVRPQLTGSIRKRGQLAHLTHLGKGFSHQQDYITRVRSPFVLIDEGAKPLKIIRDRKFSGAIVIAASQIQSLRVKFSV